MDKSRTALVIIDPQNDFLSEGGAVWDLVWESLVTNGVVNKLKSVVAKAKGAGIPLFYSLHLPAQRD